MSKNKQNKEKKHAMGWECPKCGNVYSPFHSKCDFCASLTVHRLTTTDSTTSKKWKQALSPPPICKHVWVKSNSTMGDRFCKKCFKRRTELMGV
jgi:hypothetical protein